jgi:hypothetical protein
MPIRRGYSIKRIDGSALFFRMAWFDKERQEGHSIGRWGRQIATTTAGF